MLQFCDFFIKCALRDGPRWQAPPGWPHAVSHWAAKRPGLKEVRSYWEGLESDRGQGLEEGTPHGSRLLSGEAARVPHACRLRGLAGEAQRRKPSSRPGHPCAFKGAGALFYGQMNELLSGVRTGGNVTTEATTCDMSKTCKQREVSVRLYFTRSHTAYLLCRD